LHFWLPPEPIKPDSTTKCNEAAQSKSAATDFHFEKRQIGRLYLSRDNKGSQAPTPKRPSMLSAIIPSGGPTN
jgi:hypothetical protein